MAPTESLLHYLSRPVPEASFETTAKSDESCYKRQSSTRNARYGTVERLPEWKDFHEDLPKELFGGHLYAALIEERAGLKFISEPNKADLEPNEERLFHQLVSSVVRQHVQEALDQASESLLHQKVELLNGNQVILLYDDDRKEWNYRPLHPDWGCRSPLHLDKDMPGKIKHNNILPGETKWKWDSRSFRDAIGVNGVVKDEKHRGLWPFRQVLTYCVKSHSRYGFIFSETELIAMRCSYNPKYHRDEMDAEAVRAETLAHGVIEWAPIPWRDSSKSRTWNTKLALFCLTILAANNGRLISKSKPFGPLKDEKLILPSRQESITPPPRSYSQCEENHPNYVAEGSQPQSAAASFGTDGADAYPSPSSPRKRKRISDVDQNLNKSTRVLRSALRS